MTVLKTGETAQASAEMNGELIQCLCNIAQEWIAGQCCFDV